MTWTRLEEYTSEGCKGCEGGRWNHAVYFLLCVVGENKWEQMHVTIRLDCTVSNS